MYSFQLFLATHYCTDSSNSYLFCLIGLPGDISALMSLGAFYSRGTGVKQDYEKSFKCYKAAADQGITQDLRLLISYSATQNFLLLLIGLIRSSLRSRRRKG